MIKIVKEHIELHYLLIERQLYISFFFFFFGTAYIPQKVLNKIKDKLITHNIFRIQDNECIVLCVDLIVLLA